MLSDKQYGKLKERVATIISNACRNKRLVNKRHLAKVIGYCSSTCLAIPSGRFHLVSLYQDLHSKDGWDSKIFIKLSNKSLNELKHFWKQPPVENVGRSWFPPSKSYTMFVSLFTDASKYAWGAHFHSTHLCAQQVYQYNSVKTQNALSCAHAM